MARMTPERAKLLWVFSALNAKERQARSRERQRSVESVWNEFRRLLNEARIEFPPRPHIVVVDSMSQVGEPMGDPHPHVADISLSMERAALCDQCIAVTKNRSPQPKHDLVRVYFDTEGFNRDRRDAVKLAMHNIIHSAMLHDTMEDTTP